MAPPKKKQDPSPCRITFELNGIQQQGLFDARAIVDQELAASEEAAFWKALGATMGFNPETVECPPGREIDFAEFTAWPAGYAPAGELDESDLAKSHEHAMDEMINAAELAEFSPGGLVYDVRDLIIVMLRSQDRLMYQKSEPEQRDTANAAEHFALVVIEKVAEQIISRGQQTVRATCGKVTMADKITVSMEVRAVTPEETDAAVMLLHRSYGKNVMISRASAQDFNTEAREAEITPDEPPLDFDAE